MSTRPKNCLILVCDGCGDDYEHDYTPHYDALGDAREDSINAGDWRTDGKDADWCPACQGKAHDCAPDPEDTHTCARCGTELAARRNATADDTASGDEIAAIKRREDRDD